MDLLTSFSPFLLAPAPSYHLAFLLLIPDYPHPVFPDDEHIGLLLIWPFSLLNTV